MSRVLVVGPGGAGKTTFAKALGGLLGLPVVHLDALYWRSGWQPASEDEWLTAVHQASRQPRWVMDGNYGGTLRERVASADTIVFLDVPRSVCIFRVLVCRLKYAGRTRPSLPAGCPERVNLAFLRWIWTYRTRRRPQVLALLEEAGPSKRTVVVRSSREASSYLLTLGGAAV